jgi:hypothetical protein
LAAINIQTINGWWRKSSLLSPWNELEQILHQCLPRQNACISFLHPCMK